MLEGLKSLSTIESIIICLPFVLLSIVVIAQMLYSRYLISKVRELIDLSAWHDLIKDPSDLPMHGFLVLTKVKSETNEYSFEVNWFFGSEWQEKIDCGKTIIAWKEIT